MSRPRARCCPSLRRSRGTWSQAQQTNRSGARPRPAKAITSSWSRNEQTHDCLAQHHSIAFNISKRQPETEGSPDLTKTDCCLLVNIFLHFESPDKVAVSYSSRSEPNINRKGSSCVPEATLDAIDYRSGRSHDPFRKCKHPAAPIWHCILSTVRLLLGLEVVQEDGALLRLLTPVLDDDARAVDNLAGVTLTVENACCRSTLARGYDLY